MKVCHILEFLRLYFAFHLLSSCHRVGSRSVSLLLALCTTGPVYPLPPINVLLCAANVGDTRGNHMRRREFSAILSPGQIS